MFARIKTQTVETKPGIQISIAVFKSCLGKVAVLSATNNGVSSAYCCTTTLCVDAICSDYILADNLKGCHDPNWVRRCGSVVAKN